MEQHSTEWFEARLGKITASRVNDILVGARGKYLATRAKYMDELAGEIISGRMADYFENDAMRWGTDIEPMARAVYELETDTVVQEVGFIVHPYMEYLGASPDGLVGEEGGLEIKCPTETTHRALVLSQKIDKAHIVQCQVGMMCTGREWWDYVNYDPRMDSPNSFYLKRIEYDYELGAEIETEVENFHKELLEMVEKLK